MKRLLYIALCLLICGRASFAGEHLLTPVPRQALNELRATLSKPQQQWLAHKQSLAVGVLNDPLPPFRIFAQGQRLEGLVADYVSALQRELGVPVQVRAFDTRGEMYAALRDGRIDMVSNVNALMAQSNGWVLSAPYSLAQLALFSEGGDLHEYSTTDGKTRIAVASGMMLELFESIGGRGRFQQYPSALLAMASVLNGENDVFLGDTVSTEYLSSQLFSNQFVINQSAKLPEVKAGFGMLPDNTVLAGILQQALGGLTRCQMISAQHLWGGTEECSVSEFRHRLSSAELDWLERAETVELVVSEDLAPFAFFNSRGRLNGIASDVLDIIRRKTGLRFKIHRVSSLTEAHRLLDHGHGTLSILPDTASASLPYLRTEPLSSTHYLFVQRKDFVRDDPDEKKGTTVAIAKGYVDPEQFRSRYPHLVFKETQTMGEAFKLVRDGRVDQALAPANMVRYYLSYKYENSLKAGDVLSGFDAGIVFGAPQGQAALISILDKALLEITPRESLQIIGRWRANSATDDKYWEGVASYVWRIFEVLGVLLLVAGVLIVAQRRRIRSKREDLQQRQLLLDELQVAKESADKASSAKSVFLATMSHEIRTPLNAIIGMLELVLTRKGDAQQNHQFAHIAYESAISLLALIGDILDISRIEAGKLTLEVEPIRVKDLLESVGNVFSGLARQKQLRLNLSIDAGAAEQVWGDAVKLKQIVSNLLGNAIKFTQQGSVDLRCSVEVAGDSELRFNISVIDTGVGIPAAQLEQIFKPFRGVDGVVSNPNAGAGLGLAISQALCLLMGSKLNVQSEVGSGTRIDFSVKLARVMVDVATQNSIESSANTATVLTVLIVEDHLPSQYLLVQQIGYLGHRTLTACNGLEGLAVWSKHDIDVVITDCNMPEMDGLEMARAIRRLEQGQSIKPCLIIGLTADAQREVFQRCLYAGMDHALAKPANLAALNRLIPKLETGQSQAVETSLMANDIQAAMAKQVITSNQSEGDALRRALDERDLLAVMRIVHKLKGTAYLLSHQVLLEQCMELEELGGDGFSVALSDAGQELLETLEQINRLLQAG